jgi:hypothetical protein
MSRPKGFIVSAETRAKLSAAHLGKKREPFSPEHGAKIAAAMRGRALSPEHRAKISAAHLGKTISPETRAKLSAALRGRKRSPETCARMSAAHRGRKQSPEHNANISAGKLRSALGEWTPPPGLEAMFNDLRKKFSAREAKRFIIEHSNLLRVA